MRESPVEASEDSQNDSKPQTQDTSQNSNSETSSKTSAELDSTPRFRKGFRRKKGESPYVCDMNVKFKKEKKQSTFLNPDPWARLVGSRNTAAIYIDGIATTALYDTGAELQLISKEFCEQNKLKIQPIEQLIECKGVVGTGLLEYDGYVEVNVQIPGRDFSEDHLFLVSSMMNSQKDMPVIVGNFFIDSLNKYLKNLSQEEFETLDKTIQNVYFASDTEKSNSQSVPDDSSVQNSNIVPSVKEDKSENVISVEIAEPRRSGRERKQTALYGSPLLYTITCKLTPKFVPVFFNKMSETLESLQTNYLMESKSDDSS